jgi:hypothetical protein
VLGEECFFEFRSIDRFDAHWIGWRNMDAGGASAARNRTRLEVYERKRQAYLERKRGSDVAEGRSAPSSIPSHSSHASPPSWLRDTPPTAPAPAARAPTAYAASSAPPVDYPLHPRAAVVRTAREARWEAKKVAYERAQEHARAPAVPTRPSAAAPRTSITAHNPHVSSTSAPPAAARPSWLPESSEPRSPDKRSWSPLDARAPRSSVSSGAPGAAGSDGRAGGGGGVAGSPTTDSTTTSARTGRRQIQPPGGRTSFSLG